MALSRLAQEMAAEIRQHDWSDAPWRIDRAGHDRSMDSNAGPRQLDQGETESVRINVMWVTSQVLGHADPNFDVYEYAESCGVTTRTPSGARAWVAHGLRLDWSDHGSGPTYCYPGTWERGTGAYVHRD
jgi:hypothetical protein